MTLKNLMERGRTPWSRRYFTTVTRLPPVAFMGSAKNRSFPSRLAGIEVGAVEVQHVLHVALFLRVVARDLEQGEGRHVPVGGVLLDLLGHDHGGQERAAEHDAHHGVLDALVHVGDLVHGEVLHGQGHRRAHDDVVLLLAARTSRRRN